MRNKIEDLEDELMELRQEVTYVSEDLKELTTERNMLRERKELTLNVSKVCEDNQRLQSLTRELTASLNGHGSTPRTTVQTSTEIHQRLKRQRTESCKR